MADKHLDPRPHHVRGCDDAWWYEEPRGICVVVEGHDELGRKLTKQRMIPWRSIKTALARKERER
jgi:hypothetical protein